MFPSKLALIARNVTVNSIRSSHGPNYKGINLPFDISNHRALAIKMTLFFGSAASIPYFVVRYQLKKSSGQYNH